MNYQFLLDKAEEMRMNAYSPYSNFTVGAALLTKSGKVYTGCNIENSAYSVTCCAERVALFKAISEGERSFVAIAIAGGKKSQEGIQCFPCGVCRQALTEFCNRDFLIIVADKTTGKYKEFSLETLLSNSFSKDSLK